jgi:DNA-binding XRE family transcriptional regulator
MPTAPETTAENKQLFLEELREKYGNITAAAKVVGISRETFYAWEKSDAAFAKAYAATLEDVKDNLESQLILIGTGAKKGNAIALIAVLNARAKDRGYSRHEISGPNSGPIRFEVVDFAPGTKRPDPGPVRPS